MISHEQMIDIEISEDDLLDYAQKCFAAVISLTTRMPDKHMDVHLKGVTVNKQNLGDWCITVDRVPSAAKLH